MESVPQNRDSKLEALYSSLLCDPGWVTCDFHSLACNQSGLTKLDVKMLGDS